MSDSASRRGFNSYFGDREAYRDGLRDQTSGEDWFLSRDTQTSEGALWWSGQRGIIDAETCEAHQSLVTADPDAAWPEGCGETRRQLVPTDQRRLSERDYRTGRKSYRTASEQTAAAGTVMASVGGGVASTAPPTLAQSVPLSAPQPPTARPTECKDISGLGTLFLGSPETTINASLGAPASRSQGTCDEGTLNAQSCHISHYLRACRHYRVVFEPGSSGSTDVVSVTAAADPTCPTQ